MGILIVMPTIVRAIVEPAFTLSVTVISAMKTSLGQRAPQAQKFIACSATIAWCLATWGVAPGFILVAPTARVAYTKMFTEFIGNVENISKIVEIVPYTSQSSL